MNKKSVWGGLLWLAVWVSGESGAAAVWVKSVQWTAGPHPRLMVDFSGVPGYRVASLGGDAPLAIELADTALAGGLAQPPAAHPVAARIGSLPGKAKGSLRLLVETKRNAPHQARMEQWPDHARLTVEWAASAAPVPAAASTNSARARAKPAHSFVVAIDAGHGGKDTGAIGPGGTLEKNVVMAIARKLAGYIQAEPGMKAVLVRRGDEFVDLRHRAAIARKVRADLFVSIHADAYTDGGVKGSSVYTLSEHGASSEAARWLADSENAALVGGPKLKDKNKLLASVLVDLSKNATLDASDKAAEKVLRELRRDFAVHHDEVQKAEFAVLKSLDVPSMLVETAFISNPEEERNLTNNAHQDRVARSVFRGIRAYCAESRRSAVAAGLRVAEVP